MSRRDKVIKLASRIQRTKHEVSKKSLNGKNAYRHHKLYQEFYDRTVVAYNGRADYRLDEFDQKDDCNEGKKPANDPVARAEPK